MKLNVVSIEKELVRVQAEGDITTNDFTDDGRSPFEAVLGSRWASHQVLVDLRGVPFLDSSAIGWLMASRRECRAQRGAGGAPLDPAARIRQVLDLLHVGRAVPIVENEAAALTVIAAAAAGLACSRLRKRPRQRSAHQVRDRQAATRRRPPVTVSHSAPARRLHHQGLLRERDQAKAARRQQAPDRPGRGGLVDRAVQMGASDLFFVTNEQHVTVQVRHLGIMRLLSVVSPETGRRYLSPHEGDGGHGHGRDGPPADQRRWVYECDDAEVERAADDDETPARPGSRASTCGSAPSRRSTARTSPSACSAAAPRCQRLEQLGMTREQLNDAPGDARQPRAA